MSWTNTWGYLSSDVTRGEDNQSRGVSEDCGQLTLALLASVMLSARLRDGARVEARGDQAIMALSSQHSYHRDNASPLS